MGLFLFSFSLYSLLSLLLAFSLPVALSQHTSELSILMTLKASLDPQGLYLSSWSAGGSDPCGGSFDGVACDEQGRVVNISLQGKGLSGQIPPEIGQLKGLSGLYLHFNKLSGILPKEIAELTELSDLYLNVNNLSGKIPPEIGSMSNLQVLQLCYNKLTGSIPTQLGTLNKLSVLALQYNQLIGAIPASLGDLMLLKRLDVSFNRLFGSIPVKIANLPILEVLDVRNNTLSGNVPTALKRLSQGFRYANNTGLCGVGFSSLKFCNASRDLNTNKPEPFGPGSDGDLPDKEIPESVNFRPNCTQDHCSHKSNGLQEPVIIAAAGVTVAVIATGLLTFAWYRRSKQKIGSTFDPSDHRLSTDQVKEVCRKNSSPLINVEYANEWDPVAKGLSSNGFSQEFFGSFMFNMEDIESATQHFSEANLLGRTGFSFVYKGVLRDGSVVSIKRIAKSSCKSDESEFMKGLKLLASLKHENLLRLRGFCCSRGRGECFLVYDFVPNGNLLQYLDAKASGGKVLEWSTRTSIILGIAKGLRYLHGKEGNGGVILHQSISAENVLLNELYEPLITGSGLHTLLADDVIFSTLKASAAMGYLAPEYATTGRFTKKSDVYAFGVLALQILSGKREITRLNHQGAEYSCKFNDFVDKNLEGNFSRSEATKVGKIALLCMHESPDLRPEMEAVVEDLADVWIC